MADLAKSIPTQLETYFKDGNPPFDRLIAKSFSTVTVVNTTAESDLARLTIPAGIVKAGDVLELAVYGDLLNNTVGGTNYTFPKVLLGATIIGNDVAVSIANNGARGILSALVRVFVVSLTSQVTYVTRVIGTGSGFGGAPLLRGSAAREITLTSAENLANATDLAVRVTHGTADPLIDSRVHAATLTLKRLV